MPTCLQHELFVIFTACTESLIWLSANIQWHSWDISLKLPGLPWLSGQKLVANCWHVLRPCTTRSATYQLPKPTRQLGRPARQRQRLFMKKPVVFERMKTYDRDCWRLEKFVSREVAVSATRAATFCDTTDININFNVSLVTDERFQLAELQKYFSPEAWDTLTSHIRLSLQGNALWKCHVCKSDQDQTGRWVQCDGCLSWLHYSCVGISRKPRGYFFCNGCK